MSENSLSKVIWILFYILATIFVFALISGFIFLIMKRRRKSTKDICSVPPPKIKENVTKIRNTSESESANVSLLSNQ